MAQITGLFILVCFKFDLELVKVIPYSILFNNALKSRPELNWLTKILVQNLLLLITLQNSTCKELNSKQTYFFSAQRNAILLMNIIAKKKKLSDMHFNSKIIMWLIVSRNQTHSITYNSKLLACSVLMEWKQQNQLNNLKMLLSVYFIMCYQTSLNGDYFTYNLLNR